MTKANSVFHKQELQFKATPDKPDAVYARKLQEVLGGQHGEITVVMQHGFQSWNSHLSGKHRHLFYGIAAEETGHVEMLAVMIAQLPEKVAGAGARPVWSATTSNKR
nr:manganese catalase family protein [Arthrobacter sp. ZGTC212]